MDILFAGIWAVLNLADVWSTHRALTTNPYAKEGNPVMRALLNFGGEWFMHGTKLVLAGVIGYIITVYSEAWLLMIPGAPLAWVVWRNTRMIR